MYPIVLFIHSWLRWLLLGALIVTLIRSFSGWLKKEPYTASDGKLRLITVILYDLQILIGIYLYAFLSPTVRSALQSMAETMKDSQLRFFVVEHTTGMLVAVLALHIGTVMTKKAEAGLRQHKCMALTLLIVLFITLVSIPWPGLPYGRVLWRGF